jgi:hypothetical protein
MYDQEASVLELKTKTTLLEIMQLVGSRFFFVSWKCFIKSSILQPFRRISFFSSPDGDYAEHGSYQQSGWHALVLLGQYSQPDIATEEKPMLCMAASPSMWTCRIERCTSVSGFMANQTLRMSPEPRGD